MFHLVYVSSAVRPFDEAELLELLEKARSNNERLGVSGMLLYKNGDFMQALEGEEATVRALSAKIARDTRHNAVHVLLEGPCDGREFPDWSMGFQDLTSVDSREVPGYSTFLDSSLRSGPFMDNPEMCRTLLMLFKNMPQNV